MNTLYLRLRQRLQEECVVPVELVSAVKPDELYFGPQRIWGKRGRQNGRLRFVQTGWLCYTEIAPNGQKKTLQVIIRGKKRAGRFVWCLRKIREYTVALSG